MPFDPKTYQQFAERVLAQKGSIPADQAEAGARTVIGRAYYGPFLQFRESLLSLVHNDTTLGPMFEQLYADTEMHGVVIDLMKILHWDSGSGLGDLRDRRNDADYVLTKPLGWPIADECVGIARSILGASFPNEEKLDSKLPLVTKKLAEHYEKYMKRR